MKTNRNECTNETAMFLRAPCKINLTLDVFDKKERTDGYHNIDSLVVPFSQPADELYIRITPASDNHSIKLTCNDSRLPIDDRNLAYRAASAFLEHIDKACRVQIDLWKNIPFEAGLGGGSSDAAAVLRALNFYFNQPIDLSALTAMAARLGSDVPLFLLKGPVRIRGSGEIIELLDFELSTLCGVLVRPDASVPTARAYALLDAVLDRQAGASTEHLLSLLRSKEALINVSEVIAMGLSNDFESVVLANYPNVAQAHKIITNAGAISTILCGSGSAVFGLARNIQHAEILFGILSVHFPFVSIIRSASLDSFAIKQF